MAAAAVGLLVATAELVVLAGTLIWLWRNSQPMSAQDLARYGPLPAQRLWGNVWLASTIATAALCIYLIRGAALVFCRSRAAAKVMGRYAWAGLCVTAVGFKAAWVSTHWST